MLKENCGERERFEPRTFPRQIGISSRQPLCFYTRRVAEIGNCLSSLVDT
jgi:hypothetical protein